MSMKDTTVRHLEMAHVVRASLQVPGMPVLTSNQCCLLAQELNRNLAPAQQGQGEPVGYVCGSALDAALNGRIGAESIAIRREPSGYINKPLYTHADPAEVERLRDLNKDCLAELDDRKGEIYALRAQLAEAQSLLREHQWHYEPYDDHYHRDAGHYCPSCAGERETGHKAGCEIAAVLSASAEPVSPMAKIAEALREKGESERAEFDRRVQSGEWGPLPDREFCAVCDGSGWKEESRAEICAYCNGHGYKEVCAILSSSAESEVKS